MLLVKLVLLSAIVVAAIARMFLRKGSKDDLVIGRTSKPISRVPLASASDVRNHQLLNDVNSKDRGQ